MRRLLKFLHTLGAIGMTGAMAAFLVVLTFQPAPKSPEAEVAVMQAMAEVATWIFLPSMALTVLAGLLAIAANPAFHDAGWVWVKAATGILIFEGGLQYVAGPIQQAAKTAAASLAAHAAPAILTQSWGAERNSLWLLLAVALANVALGVWRPRMPQYPV